MENERDLCNIEKKCTKVRVYNLLHGYNIPGVPLWPLASSCLTIRIKAWRISKNGKLYYVFAQKIHIYSLPWLKLTLVLHTRMYIVLHRTTLTCPGCV